MKIAESFNKFLNSEMDGDEEFNSYEEFQEYMY